MELKTYASKVIINEHQINVLFRDEKFMIFFSFFEFKFNLVEGVILCYLHIHRNNIYANNLHI